MSYGSDPLASGIFPNITADCDVNMDGQVNAADVLLAQMYILGLIVLSAPQISHGDVYPATIGDDDITLSDLLLIYKNALFN